MDMPEPDGYWQLPGPQQELWALEAGESLQMQPWFLSPSAASLVSSASCLPLLGRHCCSLMPEALTWEGRTLTEVSSSLSSTHPGVSLATELMFSQEK